MIDTSTKLVIATIDTGADPQNLAFIPNTNLAYVTNQLSNDIFVIDTWTNMYLSNARLLLTYNAASFGAPRTLWRS